MNIEYYEYVIFTMHGVILIIIIKLLDMYFLINFALMCNQYCMIGLYMFPFISMVYQWCKLYIYIYIYIYIY